LFPRISANDGEANSFLSKDVAVSRGNSVLNYYNAIYGSSKQLRMIVLVFKNSPMEISIEQENYWVGGNKNEFVVCVGIDDSLKINWVKPFSWTMKKEMMFSVRDSISNMPKFNAEQIANYLGKIVPKEWKRRQFKEFSYLDVQESSSAMVWCFVVMFALTGIWSVIVIIQEDF